MDGLEAQIVNSEFLEENGMTKLTVKLSQATKFITGYAISTISYQSGNNLLQITPQEKIPAEFYKDIYNVAGWAELIADPTQNYRLKADIDFNQVTLERNITVVKVPPASWTDANTTSTANRQADCLSSAISA